MPICLECREANTCPDAYKAPTTVKVPARVNYWTPNKSESIKLPCGCTTIAWPIIYHFGKDMAELECNIHGKQTFSRHWKEQAVREASKIMKERQREAEKRSQMTIEELMENDPPPF